MAKKLYVGNLPYDITSDSLKTLFSDNGALEVGEATVIMDRDTGRSKGFGFVEFANDADADAAIEKFNGAPVGEPARNLTVNEARPREERPQGGGGYRGGNGGGYRGGNRDGGNRGGGYGNAAF